MKSKDTLIQLRQLTETMVKLSLSDDQNFPSIHGKINGDFEITVNNATCIVSALKNIAYEDIYTTLEQARCFNLKMLDGALMILRYRFRNGNICEHSLSYFPSPNLENFQNDPELYMLDEIYADIISRNIVAFPIRFDFSDDIKKFVEIDHPLSHMTLGQYAKCRIPVCSPISPLTFGDFVLRNFYNTAFRKYSDSLPVHNLLFAKTITAKERMIPHLVLG